MSLPLLGGGRGSGGAGGGGGGLPVANTIGWWDASVFASLNLTGSSINSIADQSTSGATMTWSNAKPTYNATGFNTSYPTMQFNGGSQQGLANFSFPLGTGNTLTLWVVRTGPDGTVASGGRVLSNQPGAGGSDFGTATAFCLSIAGTTNNAANITRNNINAAATISVSPAPIREIITIDSSGVMTIYINGVSGGTATASGNWATNSVFCIGRRADANLGWWGGPISEVGVSTDFTNSTDVATLDTALKTKWGL